MGHPVFDDPEFQALNEEDQISKLRGDSQSFRRAYRKDPEATLARMRELTHKPKTETSTVGTVIREFGSGLAESALDAAQLPFEAAEWVASAAGSDWRTGVDDAIEEYTNETFPEPETAAGRVARSAGYWGGVGAQTFMTGGAAAATKLPLIAKAGKFITGGAEGASRLVGGLGAETAAGAAGGAADAAVMETELGQGNPWLAIGAGILAGGAMGVGIAARNAQSRAKRVASGEGQQPSATSVGEASPPTPSDVAKRDAMEGMTTDEQRQLEQMWSDPDSNITGNERATAAHDWDVSNQQGRIHDTEMEQMLGKEKFQAYLNAAGQAAIRSGVERPPGRTLMSYLTDLVQSGKLGADEIAEIIGDNDLDLMEIANVWQSSGSMAGERLGRLGNMAQKINKERARFKNKVGRDMTPEELGKLRADAGRTSGMGMWRRLENVRRGLLVTQVATAARNFETQVANLVMTGMESAMEAGLQKVINPLTGAATTTHFSDALSPLARLAGSMNPVKLVTGGKSKSYRQTKALEEVFAAKGSEVLEPLNARLIVEHDILTGGGPVGGLEKVAYYLNGLNRLQESTLRRVFFSSELDRLLKISGPGLDELEMAGKLGSIPRKTVEEAVNYALTKTWGREFNRNAMGAEGVAGSLIHAVNNTGLGPFQATQILPFPRFMANSLKWQWEHAPLPLRMATLGLQDFRHARNGNMAPLAKSIAGTGLFLSAYQIRQSQPEGGKWYNMTVPESVANAIGLESDPNGSYTFDTRPFNPFSSFLFAADLVHRANNGTLNQISPRDVAMGIMSVNLRAGAGLYVLDQFLDSITSVMDQNTPDQSHAELIGALAKGGAEYSAAAWAGALVPFQMLKDVTAHFDESQRALKDQNAQLSGAFARKIPYGDENLPDVQLPTREATPESAAPLTRQLTGFTLRGPNNPAETELNRLGFSRGEILGSSKDRGWDQLRAKYMGPIVEQKIGEAVLDPRYLRLDDEEKGVKMMQMVKTARDIATRQASQEDPEAYAKSKAGRRPKRVQKYLATQERRVEARKTRMEKRRKGNQ